MFLFNPFEQFEIMLIIPIVFGGLDLSLTNLTILAMIISGIVLTLNYIFNKSYTFIPNNWQLVMEAKYQFVFSILAEQTVLKDLNIFLIY
jgi:F0F1-type ATP synthase membrane subunit a